MPRSNPALSPQPNFGFRVSPMRKTAALAAFLTLAAPLAALAQSHTPEDEAACTPDVLSLCQQYIPRRQEIIACLTARKAELSPPCHAVFSRPAQSNKVEEPRRRSAAGSSSRGQGRRVWSRRVAGAAGS